MPSRWINLPERVAHPSARVVWVGDAKLSIRLLGEVLSVAFFWNRRLPAGCRVCLQFQTV
jgi:hypothetical protein